MIVFPNAKINIGLNVVSKREDGYHNLETVFFPIPIHDSLEVVHWQNGDSDYKWGQSGIEVDTPAENNICIKALKQLSLSYSITPIQIHLHKAIPFGAGLGGGSADAAFMLKLLSDYFSLNISRTDLKQMAVKLGADCSFFIDNEPAFATGIGDILTPIKVNLQDYFLVLVKPPIHVSTMDAYSGVKPSQPQSSLINDVQLPVSEWKNCIKNDFEASVFQKHPAIEAIKTKLYNEGAEYAAMSGSGSSVFGLFRQAPVIQFANCELFLKAL